MNKIYIPIRNVLLETVFTKGERSTYALLEPGGDVTPLRVRFDDLRQKLADRFSPDLSEESIATRLSQPSDLELFVIVNLERRDGLWDAEVRLREQPAKGARTEATLRETRKSPRRAPPRRTDIKLELGQSTLAGTLYNISEHGLGIALHTTQLESLEAFRIDREVEIVGPERLRGRIRSQYPADGGCVLGIELKDRFDLKTDA